MTPESKCCSLGAGRTTRESRAAAMQQGGKPHAGGGALALQRGRTWTLAEEVEGGPILLTQRVMNEMHQ